MAYNARSIDTLYRLLTVIQASRTHFREHRASEEVLQGLPSPTNDLPFYRWRAVFYRPPASCGPYFVVLPELGHDGIHRPQRLSVLLLGESLRDHALPSLALQRGSADCGNVAVVLVR
jgi:hypothetical protein